MLSVQFRFHGELNDFLLPAQRGVPFAYPIEPHQSLKHLIEALGVPHLEVRRVEVNGQPAHLSARLWQADQVEVFPGQVGELPPGEPRFILDNHLGRLAAYLRMFGLDTLYRNDYQDEQLAMVASQKPRILLTRDRHLLMRKNLHYGYWVRHLEPPRQLVEVLRHFGLSAQAQPFKRCLRCNSLLQPVSKEQVLERLEPLTRLYYDEFHICRVCDKVYWKGSHYTDMLKTVQQAQSEARAA